VNIFPEGGLLVANLPNIVYFEALDGSSEDPVDIEAELIDQNNQKVQVQ
jgi:hypothetical protein